MKFLKKTLTAALFSLISIPAAADDLLSCQETKKPKALAFSYVIKATESSRLASDITYKSAAGQTVIISSLQVAQYVRSKALFFMLIDDPTESPIISFHAVKLGRAKKFIGYVREIDPATQKVTSLRKLSCTLVGL